MMYVHHVDAARWSPQEVVQGGNGADREIWIVVHSVSHFHIP